MPASRSPSRAAEPIRRSRSLWPVILIALAALLAVIVVELPASIVTHFLPPTVHAEDFSGSIWHGSAGKITVIARDAGALEWRLHPAALLGMAVAADLHWVKVGFVIDGAVKLDGKGVYAHDLKGGGPIEDLRDLGVAAGWRGTADVNFTDLKIDFGKPRSAVGDIRVSRLAAPQIADGADLGGYDLRLADGAVDGSGNVTAQLNDTGGPLDLQAVIHYAAADRTGLLSGTVRERAGAPPALLGQLENLSQLRGRNPQGRIPVDLEFSF
jgi:Type II secretion system (T2SS), protein N